MSGEPMPKILVVFGTRPEAIKLCPVVLHLRREHPEFSVKVCVTAQQRHLLDQVLEVFQVQPDYDLDCMRPNQSLFYSTSNILVALERVLLQERPDLLLVQGDTTSTLCGALAGFYTRVPVGHVEAGLRTNQRYEPFPEEINRRLISSLATWHYAPTETAVAALIREGADPRDVFLTGNTVVDALLFMSEKVEPADIPQGLRLILVTAHRRESFGAALENLCLALRDLVERNPDVMIVYPVHLNPKVREPVFRILAGLPRVELHDPVSYREIIALMKSSYLILTDSGGIQEEAPVFGKPVLVLRDHSERPDAIIAGTAKLVGTDRKRILSETEALLQDQVAYRRMSRAISPYGDGHAAMRIVQHLLSLVAPMVDAASPPDVQRLNSD